MLSKTLDYALRAVIWLAEHPGSPQAAGQLAHATGVSANYLPKVMQPLIRQRYVSGVRGLHGGYSLAADPATIRVLDIVNCVDPDHGFESCPRCLPEHVTQMCPLHRFLRDTSATTRDRLASVSIQDLVEARAAAAATPPQETP